MLQLAESKTMLKMCFSKNCHKVTGFLLWIGTYCIRCVAQQRSRIKDLFPLSFSLLINKYTNNKLTIIRCQSQRLIWRRSESYNVLLSYNENKN